MPATQTISGSRSEIVATLQECVRRLEQPAHASNAVTSSGCAPLDQLLPGRGFPARALVEWLSPGEASGAGVLAWLAVRAAAEAREGAVVILDRQRNFYPPAAIAWGVSAERLMVIRATTVEDELWAWDQALRCVGVAAVWGVLPQVNQRWFRRLQLAAEAGGAIGHLLRPARVLRLPSWSYARVWVEPRPVGDERSAGGGRRWHVELMRCHGLARSRGVDVELDEITGAIRDISHETHPVPVATQLAYPASQRRSARA